MPLNANLLDRLERCWRAQRFPWFESGPCGASDQALDQIAERLQLELPAELRSWWSWHNADLLIDSTPVPGVQLHSIQSATRATEMMRGIATDAATDGADPEDVWPANFLAVFGANSTSFAVRADSGHAESSPLAYVDSHTTHPPGEWPITASSIADVVSRWCEAYKTGFTQWDATRSEWKVDRTYQPTLLMLA